MGNTRSERKCSVSGCSKKHHTKGYCKIHKELKAAGNLAYRAGRYGAKSDKIKREDVVRFGLGSCLGLFFLSNSKNWL